MDTKNIDVMMGTFTKSFGGMGGYIAGKYFVFTSSKFPRRRLSLDWNVRGRVSVGGFDCDWRYLAS